MKNLVLGTVLLLFAGSCTAFKKKIDKTVVIALPDTMFIASVSSTALNAKYTNTVTHEAVMGSFLKGFKSEGKITPNVVLRFNADHADYILKFKGLEVIETSKNQKIEDPKSPYIGQDVVLNVVDVTAEFEITAVKDPSKKIMNCTNTKQRAESATNNRNLDDLIAGANKDKTQYRTRLLSDNIALTLSEDVGRRIWVPISRRVTKNLK